MLAPTAASGTTYYGPPYFTNGWYVYDPTQTLQQQIDDDWIYYSKYWGVSPYGGLQCGYTFTPSGNGETTGNFGSIVWTGQCWGGNEIVATAYPYQPGKNTGKPCNCAGDPINLGTGNEYRDDEDAALGKLSFHRYYNSSAAVASSHIGAHWRQSFDRRLEYLSGGTTSTATVFRPDGLQVVFTLQKGQWTTDPDVADRLTPQTNATGAVSGWLYFDASTRDQEAYDANGNLLSITDTNGQITTLAYSTASTPPSVAPSAGLLLTVTDSRGRSLNFTYNAQGNIVSVTQPDGGVLGYAYDTHGNLVSVTYPDSKTRQYVYNESTLTGGTNLPNVLTGDIDETGARFTSIGYNSQGQATMSTLPGGIDLTQVTYNSNSTTSVTYPTGASATLSFVVPNGSVHASTVSAPCGPSCGQPNAVATFDSNGYVASTTDFNGNVTAMTHDANGLLDQQVDGSGSANQRTTDTTWNTTLRVPLTRTVLDASGNTVARTGWVYNTRGQPLARCEIDPAQAGSYACAASGSVPPGVRRWTYTYCDAVGNGCPLVGLRLSVTGPRTDLVQTTTYSYYPDSVATGCGTPGGACHQPGDLYQITDPLGHVTTIASYDADGRITRATDANGINTDLTYTPRGWLASRSVGGATTTTFAYTPYGAVASVTDPDNVTTTFTYDAAHRLTDITDAQGNRIHYTLDAAGNKTKEQVLTASGTVVRSLSRAYNTLGQLTAVIDGLNQTVFNANYSDSYDGNGNLVHSADALGVQRQQGFDALNRLQSTIANYNGSDPATSNTQTAFDYDAMDRLDGVADPSGLNTLYTYDGLGNRTELASPDTGTSTDTYDAAGNRLTHTDARGVVGTSTFDALNRLTGTSYADSTLNVSYDYDEPDTVTGCTSSSSVGRLTRVVEGSVSTVYCYDGRGNITEKQQVTSTQADVTQYTYTAANRLGSESTPDRTVIAYSYDSNGRINGMQVTPSGATTAPPTVVSAISYLPFGPISSYTLGNGQVITRTYDANERLTDLTSPALNLHLARDAMGDIVALGNPATETYSYDPLYRLTGITDAGTALESYSYNRTGDRLSKTATDVVTGGGAYTYTTGTHQLASIGNAARTNDANGNTTSSVMGGETFSFSYDGRNRLAVVQRNGVTTGTYLYNASGQRIGKITGSTSTVGAHVSAALGRLIGKNSHLNPHAVTHINKVLGKFQQSSTERYAYNEASQLIGEYGATNRDYVWLGNLPVAVIDNTISGSVTTSTVNYIIAGPLGAPRAVTDGSGTLLWSWAYQGNPFGEQQPTSTTGYVLNLRYPGQYYDAESNTSYNMFRNYEPATGRYLQSDPIGLGGGISTYAYVGNNPLSYTDPRGLAVGDEYRTIDAAGIAAVSDVLSASITQNIEYAGVVYRNWNGSYSYTAGNPGTENTSYAGDPPWFHTEVADYHTHSADDENGLAEIFSPADMQGNDEQHIFGYLGTPRLAIKKYDPCSGKVTILQIGVTP